MSLRVLLASHSRGLGGGAERSLLQIACYLSEHGVDVSAAVPGAGALSNALEANGVKAAVLDYGWKYSWAPSSAGDATDRSLSALREIAKYVHAARPDVVMTNTLVIPWFAFVANQLGIRHVWFIREDLSNDPGFAYPDVERTLRLIRATADGVFVPSAYMRDLYRRLLDRDDVELVYPTFDASIAGWASRRPDSTGRRVVVCATVMPHKNQLEVLRAASILHEQGLELELTIIGVVASQEYLDELRDFIRERNLENVVSIEARTDDPYAVLAAHDICVVPSTNEPSSRVMVEAMLVGTAVVASDVGGNVEKAGGDRAAAVLYPLGRADLLAERLAELLNDRARLREQAARGHSFAVDMYVEQDQLSPLLAGLEQVAVRPAHDAGPWVVDELIERSAEHARLGKALRALQGERDDAQARAERETSRAAKLEADVRTLTEQIDALQGLANAYASSRSWRVTEPARALGRGARKIIGNTHRDGHG